MAGFWTSFLPRKKGSEPDPLPLQARLATLESEVLGLRELGDRHYTSLRKLQGKVYRGVALGDTTEALEEQAPDAMEPVGFAPSKAALYEKAAKLRKY